jgi:hypothetical protein
MRISSLLPFCICLACLTFCGFSQHPDGSKKNSLLVAEYDQQAAKNNLQHLVLYKFSDGKMTGKEDVLAVPGKKDGAPYVRFDLGINHVYKNRYIVTGIGNVIDLQTKKVVVDSRDQFVKFSGDSIVFFTNDIFKGKYYSVFDIRTGLYKKVEKPSFRAIRGQDIEVDYSTRNYRIFLYPASAPKELIVKDAGYGEEMATASQKSQIPFFWVDDASFVYANFSSDHSSASIWIVNANKSAEKIGEIDGVPASQVNSKFYLDDENNLLFTCMKGDFQVDLKKKKLLELPFQSFGNGFKVETDENVKYGRVIKYNDQVIGKYFCNYSTIKTTVEGIAFQYDLVVNGEHYAQGLAVWNASTKHWTELDNTDVANVIGWASN